MAKNLSQNHAGSLPRPENNAVRSSSGTGSKKNRGVVRSWLLRCRQRLDHWKTQVYVVSYPKAGRTWLNLMLGKAVCEQFGVAADHILRSRKFTRSARLSRTVFTHARSLPSYRDKKILLLVRDPRDVVVSHYFDAGLRRGNFAGTISEFIRDGKYGIQQVVNYYRTWEELGDKAAKFAVLTYVDMRTNPTAALKLTLKFIGVAEPCPDAVARAVAYTSFDNMKRMEALDVLREPALRPKDATDPRTFKVRRGKVGGFRDELSGEDIAYLNEVMVSEACPFYVPSAVESAAA